jgi:putative exporter of polyketide antibiotics
VLTLSGSLSSALARRAFRDARVRTIAFAFAFGIYSYLQPVAYRHGYPTLASRITFARSFGDNKAIRLFYGVPHRLLTVGGYAAWRVGGTLAIAAAVFGLLATVRALRTEEDTGRMELVLAAAVGRRTAYVSALAAIAAGVVILWVAEFAGFLLGGLSAGGSAYLALATASVVAVCAGVGAVASELAPTRRIALELGGGVLGLLFVLRVIADTASGVGWLRWLTPLGWAEQMRPFGGAAAIAAWAAATAGDRQPERRAADVVQAGVVEEADRGGIAAVLAADPELDVRGPLAPEPHRRPHELADAGLVDRGERRDGEDPIGDVAAG